MEYLAWNIICLIIVILVCWLGIVSFPKGTDGREAFVFILITSFIPYVALFYVICLLIILASTLFMWFIAKLSGTN